MEHVTTELLRAVEIFEMVVCVVGGTKVERVSSKQLTVFFTTNFERKKIAKKI